MVGQLIRLKARMTWNTLSRQTVVLVLGILGILYGLAVVVTLAAGVFAAAISGHGDLVNAALVIADTPEDLITQLRAWEPPAEDVT